jgi:hypothetical protein
MFLIIAEQTDRHSDYVDLQIVGEFSSDEEADSVIVAKADDFYQAHDGGGTRFIQVEEKYYIKHEGEFYVQPESFLNSDYGTPEKVRKQLEPY